MLVHRVGWYQPLNRRPRHNRKPPALRAAFQETSLTPANFVYPLFIHEGEEDTPIGAMPGCYRLGWRHGLLEEVSKARVVGVNSVVLFPKSPSGDEAYNDNGLVPRTIRLLKDKYPDLITREFHRYMNTPCKLQPGLDLATGLGLIQVGLNSSRWAGLNKAIYTNVALDPYNSDGHDGIISPSSNILIYPNFTCEVRSLTIAVLFLKKVSLYPYGPHLATSASRYPEISDMMDDRVGAIRAALDAEGMQASSFYGPFREALDSNPRFGDKKTYQMNPANYREDLVETTREDESEGTDILLVKHGLP
ncbi:aldolase superfamily protein [Actinidia rufa]|uniref:porphobilinogen synthase n=1 Tax=Actinidia rufa TaxID=165716 RepID=A0A7J0FDA1_9ERIC|nr:aldolase superfamily protein [Actinidia rufa]